jgi:hypothetical protein
MTDVVPPETALKRGAFVGSASDMTPRILAAVLVYSTIGFMSRKDGGIAENQVSMIKHLGLLTHQQVVSITPAVWIGSLVRVSPRMDSYHLFDS